MRTPSPVRLCVRLGWASLQCTWTWQVCMLSRICRNGAQLFSLERGELFACDYDHEGYLRLASTLQSTGVPRTRTTSTLIQWPE